jgi:phosphatidylglycerophosphate synthase
MLDRAVLNMLARPLQALAAGCARIGIGPTALTVSGFALGLMASLLIAHHATGWALGFILASRLADGLDGAVARLTQRTSDRGAFLDITLDFLFYASVPLAFAWANPSTNALAAATLLAAFVGTGSSFLAFAVLAAKRAQVNPHLPQKGFYFLGGLTEGTETIAVLVLMCLWPTLFVPLAYGFALLCALTIASRVWAGWKQLA